MVVNTAASVPATAQKILLPMIRQVFPTLIAQHLGVQPMTAPTGSIFTMRASYEAPHIIKFHKKYKFSRAKWYIAEFNWRNTTEVNKWCTAHFGPHDKCPNAWSRWRRMYDQKVYFRDEDDAIMFKLRWPS